tara:strand:+ start:467 stop:622 length:156 start_codon:yes stop_codon:yes gene_type:complete
MFKSRRSKNYFGQALTLAVVVVGSVMYAGKIKEMLAKVPYLGEFVTKNSDQ